MARIIFNGEAGEAWTNDTDFVRYQFVASLTNTCGTCLQYHMAIGSYWPIPLHRNCLLPGTRVVAPGVKSGLVARYDGDAVRVTMTDGTTFAVTANHMLLTPLGFLRAKDLVAGDHVINCLGGQREGRGGPNNDWQPTPIEDVVDSLSVSRSVLATRMPVTPEDLHGDGRFCNGDIDVVSSDGLLLNDIEAVGSQGLSEFVLGGTGLSDTRLAGRRRLNAVLFAMRDATDGGVGSLRDAKSLRLGHLRHAENRGFFHPTRFDAVLKQNSSNHSAAYSELDGHGLFSGSFGVKADRLGLVDWTGSESQSLRLRVASPYASLVEPTFDDDRGDAVRIGDALHRFAGQVSLSRIRDVESFHYIGPVYDVETTSTLYAIENGITSSNCSCRQELIKPGATAEPWVDYREMLDGMSPAQQREAIGASNYKLLKEGVVTWDDVVTNTRVRSFREVVAREKLAVPELQAVGVREGVAKAAWDSVNTTGHQAARAHRKILIDNLAKAGVTPQQVKERFGAGMAERIKLIDPHRPGGPVVPVEPMPIEPLIPTLGLDAKKVKAAIKPKAPVSSKTFPASIDGLTHGRRLGGETGARLVLDPATGVSYVLKRGANEGQLRSEAAADAIYRAAGVPVPESRVYETEAGPAKLSEFIVGRTLGSLKRADKAAYDRAVGEIQKGFAVDALLANRDVVGSKMDNIIVDEQGVPHRVDNGGALGYLPDGRRKAPMHWSDSEKIVEVKDMRDVHAGGLNYDVFGSVTDETLRSQIDDLGRKAGAILDAASAAYRSVLKLRMKLLDGFKPKAQP